MGIGRVGFSVLATLMALPLVASCASEPTETTASPTSSSQGQVVRVTSGEEQCGASPYIVQGGTVTITATGAGSLPTSVTLYAPKKGAFAEQLDQITVLAPGATKSMTIELGLGAYEISCKTNNSETRSRITAV
jgi:hypothetical protein